MVVFALLGLLAQDAPPSLADEGILGWRLETRVRAYYPQIGGGIKGEHDEPTVSLEDDLEIDSPRWTPSFELALYWDSKATGGLNGVGISGTLLAASGEETLDSPEVFQDHVFPAGTTVRSRFRFKTFGVDAIWATPRDAPDLFGTRFTAGLHYLEAEVHFSGAAGSESEEYSDANFKFTFTGEVRPVEFAFAGVTLGVYTDVFSLLAGQDSGHYAGEIEAFAGFQVGPVRLEGGYRVFGWTLNWYASEIDLVTYGPWVSASVRF